MNDEKMEPILSLCFDVLRQKSGRKMDSAFIEAGFVGVQAEIDLFSITFGRDSHESLFNIFNSAGVFELAQKKWIAAYHGSRSKIASVNLLSARHIDKTGNNQTVFL